MGLEIPYGIVDGGNIMKAEEKGMTVPQIATAYVLNQPLNIYALVGAASRDEFKDNLAACDLNLTPYELAWLDLRLDSRS